MGLGAMMVLDAYGGGYGTYTPHTILVHALAGGFLFFLPFVLSQGSAQLPQSEAGPFSSTALLLLPFLDKARALIPAEDELSPRVEAHLVGLQGAALFAAGRTREAMPLLEEAREFAPTVWAMECSRPMSFDSPPGSRVIGSPHS